MNGSFIRGLLCAALISLVFPVFAVADNWKTLKKSEKNPPAWLNRGLDDGMLMVSAEAPSLQEARSLVEKSLLHSLIQAVAVNVKSVSTQTESNIVANDKVTFNEEYMSSFEVAAANLPFMKGISLSEAVGQYWELRENKKSKQSLYFLTVLYPLPEEDLIRMRWEFDQYDRTKQEEYDHYSAVIDKVNSTEQINEAIAALKSLEEYFFDSVRKTQTATLLQRYSDLFKMVTLTGEQTEGKNEFIVRTELRGKPFVTGKVPEVTSECASRIKVVPLDGGSAFRVTYSNEDCLPDELNSLKVTMRLSSARLSASLPF